MFRANEFWPCDRRGRKLDGGPRAAPSGWGAALGIEPGVGAEPE